MIDNMHTQFIQAVADGRHEKVDDIRAIADGKVWTGEQAMPLNWSISSQTLKAR